MDVTLYFNLINLDEINTPMTLNVFILKIKKTKNVHIYSPYKELKDRCLKFLKTDRNSPGKSYTVNLSDNLKFLTRLLNNVNKDFMDEYAKNLIKTI